MAWCRRNHRPTAAKRVNCIFKVDFDKKIPHDSKKSGAKKLGKESKK